MCTCYLKNLLSSKKAVSLQLKSILGIQVVHFNTPPLIEGDPQEERGKDDLGMSNGKKGLGKKRYTYTLRGKENNKRQF